MDYIFPYYDNLYDKDGKHSGKVELRHYKSLPADFSMIRKLACMITDYKELVKRSDNRIEQFDVKRNINQLDDAEIELVAQCADEIINVMYRYKKLCMEYHGKDYSEFLVERKGNGEEVVNSIR